MGLGETVKMDKIIYATDSGALALIVAGALLVRFGWWYDREQEVGAEPRWRVAVDLLVVMLAVAAGFYLFGLGVLRAW